ncbi:hypothetical protein GQ457_11G024620 [Hibiscus cannabinus]
MDGKLLHQEGENRDVRYWSEINQSQDQYAKLGARVKEKEAMIREHQTRGEIAGAVSSWPSSVDKRRIILAEQDNLLTFSELARPCRIILAEQDNLLTFSESQERCHLGLQQENLLTFSELAGPERCHLGLQQDNLLTFSELAGPCRIILAEQDNLLTFSEFAGLESS